MSGLVEEFWDAVGVAQAMVTAAIAGDQAQVVELVRLVGRPELAAVALAEIAASLVEARVVGAGCPVSDVGVWWAEWCREAAANRELR